MSLQDQVVIPQSALNGGQPPAMPSAPPATTPTEPSFAQSDVAPASAPVESPEIAYLRAHGEDAAANELGQALEAMLKGQQPASAPVPSQPAQAGQPAPAAPQTAQERALDPYSVDGATPAPNADQLGAEDADGDEGVVIGEDGRARNATTGKFVPLKALHRERDKAKTLNEENAKLREMTARAEERLAVLNEFLTKSAEPEAPAATEEALTPPMLPEDFVDPEVDIFKFSQQIKEFAKKQSDYIKKLEEKVAGTETQTRAQIEELATAQMLYRDVQSFAAKQPDLPKAYEYARKQRDNILQALGFKDPAERAKQIEREEKILQQDAVRNKRSYAETLYNLAQAYGYVPASAAAAAITAPAAPAPAAAQPAPAPAAPPATSPEAAAKVQAIANGQQMAGGTLSGHGGSGGGDITVARLAQMSEAEFLDLAAKLGGKGQMDRYFRGI